MPYQRSRSRRRRRSKSKSRRSRSRRSRSRRSRSRRSRSRRNRPFGDATKTDKQRKAEMKHYLDLEKIKQKELSYLTLLGDQDVGPINHRIEGVKAMIHRLYLSHIPKWKRTLLYNLCRPLPNRNTYHDNCRTRGSKKKCTKFFKFKHKMYNALKCDTFGETVSQLKRIIDEEKTKLHHEEMLRSKIFPQFKRHEGTLHYRRS